MSVSLILQYDEALRYLDEAEAKTLQKGPFFFLLCLMSSPFLIVANKFEQLLLLYINDIHVQGFSLSMLSYLKNASPNTPIICMCSFFIYYDFFNFCVYVLPLHRLHYSTEYN